MWTPNIKKTVLEQVTIMSESETWAPSLLAPSCRNDQAAVINNRRSI